MSAFFKVEQGQAHLIVRAPLYLFKAVRFPVKNIEIDVDHSAEAVQRALAALQRDIVVEENGSPLQVLNASARLSLPSDRSFASYDDATRHVATPIEPDTHIVIDQGYVDAHFVYQIASTDGVFSLRTSAGAEIGTKIAIRYIGAGGEERAVLVRSGSGTVELNPSVWGAARGFIGLGVQHILTGLDHLLFLLCLIIPLRGIPHEVHATTTRRLASSWRRRSSAGRPCG